RDPVPPDAARRSPAALPPGGTPAVYRTSAAALALVLAAPAAHAAEPVDYLREVKPLLRARCYACHGALQQKAKLRLDTAELIRTGGRTGPAGVPGRRAGRRRGPAGPGHQP